MGGTLFIWFLSLYSYILDNHATISNITIRDWLEMFLVSNSIVVISTILGLSFLDPKDLSLPYQFWEDLDKSVVSVHTLPDVKEEIG